MSYPLFHPDAHRPLPFTMTRAAFLSEYPGEGDDVEFKSGTSSRQLQDTAVAFSNAAGGVLILGVADDGALRGRALDSATADTIHQMMRDAYDVGRYELHPLDVDGTPLTIVAVAARREGFSQTSAGIVRVRRGTRDDALFGPELQRFINERSQQRYERTPTALDDTAIDHALMAELAAAFGWGDRELHDRLDEHGYRQDGRLTIAGALFLTAQPERLLGKTYIELVRFRDDDALDYDRREEIRGPVHHQLRDTVSRVGDELGTQMVVLGVRRYELPRLPEVVVREAIANALAHRSYEDAGTPVRVELRPGLVRVISPGGLPEPVTVQNMREANAARNLAVIGALRRFGLAEDAGRGVRVMQDAMREEMLDPPAFADHGYAVEVVLPIRSPVAPVERAWVRELEQRGALSGADRITLVHAARGEIMTNARVRAAVGTDAADAREILQRLRDLGLLEQRGSRGGSTYHLSGSLHPPAGLRLTPDELADMVERLAAEQELTNARVREATGLDRVESLSILNRLVREGRLTRTGSRRGTRYRRPRS